MAEAFIEVNTLYKAILTDSDKYIEEWIIEQYPQITFEEFDKAKEAFLELVSKLINDLPIQVSFYFVFLTQILGKVCTDDG